MDEHEGRLGLALARLIGVAARDDEGRTALLELAAAITELTPQAAAPPPSLETAVESVEDVVDIDQAALAALLDRTQPVPAAEPSRLAEAFRAAAAVPPASPATYTDIVVPARYQELATVPTAQRDELRSRRDAVLPALAERARAKAQLTRSLAQAATGGPPLDAGPLHRTRSLGATTWMADLRDPDPVALTRLADCFAALADLAEYITLLPGSHGAENERFATAVRTMAAVLSAHRLAALALRQTPDEDQAAGFDWLKDTTAEERIFVTRHMRLDDPFDVAALPDLMEPIRTELESLRAADERKEVRTKALGQLRYHAKLLGAGGTDHDRAKVVEAVERLVRDGMPPSSLELRAILVPIRADLASAADPDSPYGRVLAQLDAHLDRVRSRPADEPEDVPAAYSAEVGTVSELIAGTSMVLIGGARRVESQAAIRDAFRLREVVWMSIEDDPTPEQFERVVRRDDVSVVLLLVRWARHAYTDVAETAARHGKPFVHVEGGYNPNGLAHDILEQASERLRGSGASR